jgi:predicted alpha-1,2-mannosidase
MDFDSLLMKRRDFLKACAATAVASSLPAYGFAAAGGSARNARRLSGKSTAWPMVGTGWHGHMFPGAVAPFGMVQLSPDTSGMPEPKWNEKWDITGWDHCPGYHYGDNVVIGFSHTHLQGTGASDLGDVLMMPLVEGRNWKWSSGVPAQEAEAQIEALGAKSGWVLDPAEQGYWSFFSHEEEEAKPGYYRVHLKTPDVMAELTTTTRCGMHRYHYPEAGKQGLMLDLVHGIGCEVYAAELHVESPTRVSGVRSTHGWAADKQVFFVIEFSRPFASAEAKVDGRMQALSVGDKVSGKKIQAIFTQSASGDPLVARVGISGTTIDGASKNLASEIAGWDFDKVRAQTGREWDKALDAMIAECATPAMRQTFDSAVYHGLVAPATFNDVDGTYRGQDHKNYPNPGFTKYTTLSIWDIYRGEFVFLMLTQPGRVRDIVETLLADYRQLNQNSLPVWPLWGNETWCMTGFHVVGIIVGAYTRGFRGFDVEAAYAAMRDTALVGAKANNNFELQKQFRELGYVASAGRNQSVSCTLDFSYDYWCVGAMAEMLGKHEDAAMFYKLGQNYRNIFDPKTGFMRGKTEAGAWREPFRPDEEDWEDYTESDAWQATFNVMQDVQGLIDLYGGDDAFIAKLDAMFAAPSNVLESPPDITGMVGQDAQGDEPSNHVPYLYTFAGAPWKTQERVRQVALLYNNTPAGVPGNDDCGQTSTWFAFAAMGFYPVNAVTGVYIIGSPMVERATLHNEKAGTSFTVVTENNSDENLYIQSATLNGKPLTRGWFTHADILAGGELRFRMGNRPNKQWGAAKEDRPPSGLVKK